jgi:hypothetical protein
MGIECGDPRDKKYRRYLRKTNAIGIGNSSGAKKSLE